MKNFLTEEQLQWIDNTWENLDKKLSVVTQRSNSKFPFWSKDHMHNDTNADGGINCWTNGFWPGINWLMYVGTKNEDYRKTAENCEKLLDSAFKNFDRISHDTGFIWRLASGPNYTLTGNDESRVRQSFAATYLMSRFNPVGGFIRAWNKHSFSEDCSGVTIIDTMLNLPILYWASDEYKDPRFKQAAMMHADHTLANHLRPDGSIRHLVIRDSETGEVTGELGGQGYDIGSCWSRGQAWAVYGFVISYIHTGKEEYLDAAKRAAHYFISAVCDTWIPMIDFRCPEEPAIYDTSAGCATACGLIEIAKLVPEYEKKLYIKAAMNLLMTIEKNYADWSTQTDFIIDMASGSYRGKEHQNENIIYADYYFTEAVYKLKGFEPLFW